MVVDVSKGLIVRFNVATVSQPPVVPGKVSMNVPATVYGLPFQINGNWLAQTEAFVIVISDHGKGIPESILHRSTGNGLNNMRKRTALLHGEMQINTFSGTTIRFIIPLNVL